MQLLEIIRKEVQHVLSELYGSEAANREFQVNLTKPEFEGDYTIVIFSLVKALSIPPSTLAQALGERLIARRPDIFASHALVKGFLNLIIHDAWWVSVLNQSYGLSTYGFAPPSGKKFMVEYSSPNTNKPLHLGHLRNNFLGWSIAAILKANGHEVVRTCIVNDRGVHICKSMIAWQRFADGATPESTGKKGDHFVGDWYVRFNEAYRTEVEERIAQGVEKAIAEKEAPILLATQELLLKWEQGDPATMELWRTMNTWVYAGFDATYRRIGSQFEKTYFESATYLLGKRAVEEGLAKGVFQKREDGSVWIDLRSEGLDEKLLLRKDGTSVYITQDIGLAMQKYDDSQMNQSIYVIGDEQNYHMKVLRLICQKMAFPYADDIHHLSYGMVELPTGKMKSREGTVVDADDIVAEMVSIAEKHTRELGKLANIPDPEQPFLFETLGIGALKFFLLRVDPKKKMIFNPEESIDFHGFTGPFIQYTYARIRSILRKMSPEAEYDLSQVSLQPLERDVLTRLEMYGQVIRQSAENLDPSEIAIYAFQLAQSFNAFYASHSVANASTEGERQLRLRLCLMTSHIIASSLSLLGIAVPERM